MEYFHSASNYAGCWLLFYSSRWMRCNWISRIYPTDIRTYARQIRLRQLLFFPVCSFNFYCVSPLGPNLYSSPFHRRNDKKNFLVSSLFRCCLHRHFIFSRKGSGCIQTFCDFIRHVRIFFCLCRALSDEAPSKQVLIIFRTDNYDWFRWDS